MSDETSATVSVVEVEIPRFTKYDEGLQDSFAKDVTSSVTRMEELAKQLISLNLAIPAIYGSVLKLTQGDSATQADVLILIAFIAWLAALGLALATLVSVKDHVNPDNSQAIEAYFLRHARRKQILVIASSLISFFGICLAVFGFIL